MTDEAILEDHAQACCQDVTHQRATANGGVSQSLHSPRIHGSQRRRSVQVLAKRLTHSGQQFNRRFIGDTFEPSRPSATDTA